LPLIGLTKYRVQDNLKQPYITPTLNSVQQIEKWTKYIAIDYRNINKNLQEISDYARERKLTIIADIGTIEDFENICENDFYYTYIATTLGVLYQQGWSPNFKLIEDLQELECNNIIAEGNFFLRNHVRQAYNIGVKNICIGTAITNIYKRTRTFTSISIDNPGSTKRKNKGEE
jgi:putative N-acetylmannosamine-6-phosphate epimerase